VGACDGDGQQDGQARKRAGKHEALDEF
jgi:hypothetical protein